LNEQQERIKEEMQKLQDAHKEEKVRLEQEYEALVQEAKDQEKVTFFFFFFLFNDFFIVSY
jgi:gas vesicle protein